MDQEDELVVDCEEIGKVLDLRWLKIVNCISLSRLSGSSAFVNIINE